jgi:predicted esterase
VSGTIPTGKTHFAWAEVPNEDYERVRLALAEARERIRWREGTAIVLGFSQGAIVGVELAVRHPEVFAGAITVSAGTGTPLQLDYVSDQTALSHQGFVIICGAKENKGSIKRSSELESWLRTRKAKTLKPLFPDHSTHSFPAAFEERFPEWVRFIQRARS